MTRQSDIVHNNNSPPCQLLSNPPSSPTPRIMPPTVISIKMPQVQCSNPIQAMDRTSLGRLSHHRLVSQYLHRCTVWPKAPRRSNSGFTRRLQDHCRSRSAWWRRRPITLIPEWASKVVMRVWFSRTRASITHSPHIRHYHSQCLIHPFSLMGTPPSAPNRTHLILDQLRVNYRRSSLLITG